MSIYCVGICIISSIMAFIGMLINTVRFYEEAKQSNLIMSILVAGWALAFVSLPLTSYVIYLHSTLQF